MNKHNDSAAFVVSATPVTINGGKLKPLPLQLGTADYGNGLGPTLLIVFFAAALFVLAFPLLSAFLGWVSSPFIHAPALTEVILSGNYLGLTFN